MKRESSRLIQTRFRTLEFSSKKAEKTPIQRILNVSDDESFPFLKKKPYDPKKTVAARLITTTYTFTLHNSAPNPNNAHLFSAP